ncbi:MAG: hypothetical protein K9L79_07285 [Methylobacter tundripaludum]|nr:hypothetical protein [Methylobacter tundripaludum]
MGNLNDVHVKKTSVRPKPFDPDRFFDPVRPELVEGTIGIEGTTLRTAASKDSK